MSDTALLSQGRHTVRVRGVNLSYEVRGEGPLLVWHPGGPGMAIQGYPGYEVMSTVCKVVYLDPRGVGQSERLVATPDVRFKELSEVSIEGTDVYALHQYGDDLAALMDLWGLSSISLAGHSHGGFVVLDFASRYPERVDKLIPVGTSGWFDVNDPRYEARRKHKTESDAYQRYLSMYQEREVGGITPLDWYRYGLMLQFTVDTHDFLKHEARLRDTVLGATDEILSFVPPWHFETYDAKTYDMRSRYKDITADVLWIQGRQELLFLPEDVEDAVYAMKSARIAWIEECGHMPMTEQPEQLVHALRGFLR